ncbi:MAG: 16S rRNA (guanine(527)-N(7))-methyltransferase RsmG, partial [Pseudomonadota bacterium]
MKHISYPSLNTHEILSKGANSLGLELSEQAIADFVCYMEEIKRWNNKVNLTSLVKDHEIIVKHFLDSIALAPHLSPGSSILDIGSGAGIPGIPLKIVRKDINITLLDSSRKKVHFLKHIARTLKLSGVSIIEGNTSEIIRSHTEMTGQYNVVISRAIGSLKDFVKYGRPFAQAPGWLVAYKGPAGEKELSDLLPWLTETGLEPLKLIKYRLPYIDAERVLIII